MILSHRSTASNPPWCERPLLLVELFVDLKLKIRRSADCDFAGNESWIDEGQIEFLFAFGYRKFTDFASVDGRLDGPAC